MHDLFSVKSSKKYQKSIALSRNAWYIITIKGMED
nr:MAG TPA: hypothetical protein [Caudoviricetes sp.]